MLEAPKIYHYDDNGIFLYESIARANPLEDGEYMIPAKAVQIPPPLEEEGYVRVWISPKWEQVEDHRGKTLYNKENGTPEVITNIGPIPDNLIEQEGIPGQYWDGNQWKYTKGMLSRELVALRDFHAVTYPVKGVDIKLNEGQRADLAGLFLAYNIQQLPTDFILYWSEKGYENTDKAVITISYEELPAFCLGALNQRQKAFAVYASLLPMLETDVEVNTLIGEFDSRMQL